MLQLPACCWIFLFISRHRGHWTPPPFLSLCGKQWHMTSLYRGFQPLVEYCLRQLWNRYRCWHQLLEVSHTASTATWGKSSSYKLKLGSPVKLNVYSSHAARSNRSARGLQWSGSHDFAAKSHWPASNLIMQDHLGHFVAQSGYFAIPNKSKNTGQKRKTERKTRGKQEMHTDKGLIT